jgi:hypothetical protein
LDARVSRDYRPVVVIELNTLRALYEHGYRLSVFCRACGRHVFLDIPTLLASGYGERAVVGLPVRCQVCGGRGELSILWDPSRGASPLRPLREGTS